MNKESIRNIVWKLHLHKLAKVVNRRAIVVLMYHGVVPTGYDTIRDDRVLSSDLEWQVRHIREHYDVRHVHEWMGGASPQGRPGAAITFDDGYRYVLTHALPILQRYGCPATVYLCPGTMDRGQRLWFDELYCSLLTSMDSSQTREQVYGRYQTLVEELKRLPPEQQAARIERVRGTNPTDDICWTEDCELLNWQDVDHLRNSGLVSFGAHTSQHIILTCLSTPDKQSEILRSHEAVKERTGACDTFAYPNGLPRDFDEESERIVRSCGMIGALTSIPGLVRKRTNPYAWPRIAVPSTVTRPRFELRASGIFGDKISRRDNLQGGGK